MDFILNRERVTVEGRALHTTLLDFLREKGLTGAKEGCAEGECGACTVALVKDGGNGPQYTPINSCLMLLPMAGGEEIYTVEALARGGELSEAQRSMIECGGSQCGYCTPGFVMSLFAEYYRPGREGPCDVHALSGNLCRCTGYRPIQEAAQRLGPACDDRFRRRLSEPGPLVERLEYRCGESLFLRPDSLAECLEVLSNHPEADVVAGGTDLAVESNLRDRRWNTLVSLDAVSELRVLRETPAEVEIGAGLTLSEVESRWESAPPVLREWFPLFSSPLIRNRATFVGNLATASPIGDGAPLLLSLGAAVKIAGPNGERVVPLDAFFPGYRRTALEQGELIVSILLPKPFPSRARFFKAAKRRMDDISTVAAAFALELDGRERVKHVRIAYGGVAATPVRVHASEEALIGEPWNERAIGRAQAALARALRPISDHRGSAEYRLALARNLLAKFFTEQREPAAA